MSSVVEGSVEARRAQLQDFFDGLAHTRGIAREAQRRLDLHLATAFSVFNFYRPDENGFSDILKDLLDPHGSHGQGAAFLAAFLRELQSERLPYHSEVRSLVREQPAPWAGRARRIDLCLRFDCPTEHVLAIENKHRAADQDDQVNDYVAWLESRYSDRWTLVYLSPAGREPPSLSPDRCRKLRSTRRLICAAYCSGGGTEAAIERWCARCLEIAQAERVRWFLRDLKTFVRETFPPVDGTAA